MIDELVAWLSAPLVLATVSGFVRNKWCVRIMHIHLFIVALVIVLYFWLRSRFADNVNDPTVDELDKRCMLGYVEGMRVLQYVPQVPPRRKVLLFPGVSNSVRRMLRYDFVKPLLKDCVIVCVQPRGLGESDRSVHMSKATMLTDAKAAFDLLLPFDLPVHVMGFSAGGFMAIQLCATLDKHCYASLTLVGTMFDCVDMALDMKVSCLALRMFQRALTIQVEQPVLLIHSEYDQQISILECEKHMALRRQHALPVKMVTVKGKHASYVLQNHQQQKISKFMRFTEGVHSQTLADYQILPPSPSQQH